MPASARTALAQATAVAYDAGFWYGTGVPEVPAYAQAVATAAHERGRFDAITAGGADSDLSDPAPEPPAAD